MEARRVVTSIARKELGYSDGKVGDAEAGTIESDFLRKPWNL